MIRIEKLQKSYGKKKVLTGIDLQLNKGKVYGIVGANGAGKTTLFRCIAGLEDHEGDVITEYSDIKNHLGYLQTQPIFLSKVTGWEHLKLSCLARGIRKDDFESQNLFDLPLNEYAENYSTGMKKKLSLMCILLQQNDVFILDEPFNGVDIQSNILISEVINKLIAKGKTILISSHIFSTLTDHCDTIHLLKDGIIQKTVLPESYRLLEEEMKSMIVGNKMKDIDL